MALSITSRDECHESSAFVDQYGYGISIRIGENLKRRNRMGDKGKKDKDKVRKQKKTKQDQEVKRRHEKEPKRTS
jgi:hypothetical protein